MAMISNALLIQQQLPRSIAHQSAKQVFNELKDEEEEEAEKNCVALLNKRVQLSNFFFIKETLWLGICTPFSRVVSHLIPSVWLPCVGRMHLHWMRH